MKEMNRNIARNISNYLNILGMQQMELAKKLECANSTVSSWIQGDSVPRLEKIDKMCEIFHCTRSDLLSDTPKTKEEIENDQIRDMFIEKFDRFNTEQKLRLLAYMEKL